MVEDSQRVALLDRWEEAREVGEPLSAEALCADCPNLLDPLKRQIDILKQIDAKLQTQGLLQYSADPGLLHLQPWRHALQDPYRPNALRGSIAARDQAEPDPRAIPPLEKTVHMSAILESTNTKTLMVVFSVPIWNAPPEETHERHSIGVLAMSVELGDFEILHSAMLVDTREDRLEGEPKSGLVLHHPELGRRSRSQLPPRLAPRFYRHAVELRDLRRSNTQALSTTLDPLIEDFHDPLAGESGGRWLAAFEPVMIKGRRREIADTGWVVIVGDRTSGPSK